MCRPECMYSPLFGMRILNITKLKANTKNGDKWTLTPFPPVWMGWAVTAALAEADTEVLGRK